MPKVQKVRVLICPPGFGATKALAAVKVLCDLLRAQAEKLEIDVRVDGQWDPEISHAYLGTANVRRVATLRRSVEDGRDLIVVFRHGSNTYPAVVDELKQSGALEGFAGNVVIIGIDPAHSEDLEDAFEGASFGFNFSPCAPDGVVDQVRRLFTPRQEDPERERGSDEQADDADFGVC